MDDALFEVVYRLACVLWPRREQRVQYSGRLIVLMYYWSVIRGKPRWWVCDRRNLPARLRHLPTPSRSQFGRRLNSVAVGRMLDQLEQRINASMDAMLVGCWLLDAKPLVVSPYSKDKAARWGWAYDRKARGYKLFALVDLRGRVVAWRVDGMNQAEPLIARQLIEAIDRPGYLIGDSIYDSNLLHQRTAAMHVQLIAPRKQPGGPIGKRARHPHRLHAIDMLETHTNRLGPSLYSQRTGIERCFAAMAASRVGLDHLPGFIRTPARVRHWVQAKLSLYAITRSST